MTCIMLKSALFIAFFSMIFLISPNAWAQQMTIRVMSKDGLRTTVEVGALEVATDQEIQASLQDGSLCTMKVLQKKGAFIIADLANCPGRKQLKAGVKLNVFGKQKIPAPGQPAQPVESVDDPQAKQQDQVQYADDGSVTYSGTSSFMDFGYTPGKKRFAVGTTFRMVNGIQDASFGGRQYLKAEATNQIFGLTGRYGLSDDFSLAIGVDYGLANSVKSTFGPAAGAFNGQSSTVKSSGLYDPKWEARYRILNQAKAPVSVFAVVNIQPSVLEAKTGTTNAEGTNGNGGHRATIGAKVAKDSTKFSIGADLSYTYADKTTTADATTGRKTEGTGGGLFGLEASGMYKFMPNLGVIGLVGYGMSAARELTDSTGTKTTYGDYSLILLGVSARFMVLPEKCYIEAGYAMSLEASRTDRISGVNVDTKINGNGFSLSAALQF